MLVISFAACGSTGGSSARAPTSPSTATVGPPPASTPSPTPAPLPTASGKGFCVDDRLVAPAVALVRSGAEPWAQVVRYLVTLERIVARDAATASDARAAFKIRQLSIAIETLARSVRGAAANYDQGDFAVRQWTRDVEVRVRRVARANGCG